MTTGRGDVVDQIKSRTRQFLGRYFRHQQLTDTDDMFAAGYVNSLFAMQLILFLESDFALTVEDADLDLDNFRSIDRIAQFVVRKQTAAAAAT